VLEALAEAEVVVPSHCIAIPDRLVEHGNPEQQLRELGVDRDGIVRVTRRLAGRRPPRS